MVWRKARLSPPLSIREGLLHVYLGKFRFFAAPGTSFCESHYRPPSREVVTDVVLGVGDAIMALQVVQNPVFEIKRKRDTRTSDTVGNSGQIIASPPSWNPP